MQVQIWYIAQNPNFGKESESINGKYLPFLNNTGFEIYIVMGLTSCSLQAGPL